MRLRGSARIQRRFFHLIRMASDAASPRRCCEPHRNECRGTCYRRAYFDKNKKEQFQKAKAVVVWRQWLGNSAPAVDVALQSFSSGPCESSGNVGKYLMFDVGTTVHGLF